MTCVIVAKIVIENWYTEKKMKPAYCVAMTDVIMRQIRLCQMSQNKW